METITEIANTVATLIFGEALKEGGKALGKSVSDKLQQLNILVRQRFKESEVEGLLIRAEKQPTETNIARVEAELAGQMKEDVALVARLKDLLKEINQDGFTHQVMLKDIEAESIKIKGDIHQQTDKAGSARQVFGTNIKVGGIFTIDGNITQKS